MGRHRAVGRHLVAKRRPPDIDRRAIVNALLDNHRTARQWRMRPNDGPPMRSVRSSFDPWNRDGTLININDTLRKLARHALNRDPAPSISVLDPNPSKQPKQAVSAATMGKKGQWAHTAMLG